MVHNQDTLQVQREHIIQLLQQLTINYQTLKSEIKQITDRYPGSEDEFSFLEEFELLITSISGYAKQIQATGGIVQSDSAIAHLHQLQVFANDANDAIARFYAEAREHYPKMQAYLQLLDYLRLLVLEYLQIQQSTKPISV